MLSLCMGLWHFHVYFCLEPEALLEKLPDIDDWAKRMEDLKLPGVYRCSCTTLGPLTVGSMKLSMEKAEEPCLLIHWVDFRSLQYLI